MHKISILDIIEDTTVDGPGFRTSVYCAGCPNHCAGCHNPQSWDIGNGHLMEVDDIMQIIEAVPFSDVTFSGGDPMFQAKGFTSLAKEIKKKTRKNIWCYTGFTFEECISTPDKAELLEHIDVLVDGRFIKELRDEDLPFRGSKNQRIIDVKRSLSEGKVITIDF